MPDLAPLSHAEIAEAVAAEAQNRYAGSGPSYTSADGVNAHLASLIPHFAVNLQDQVEVIGAQSDLIDALQTDLRSIRQLSLPAGYESGDTEIAKLAGDALDRITEFHRQVEATTSATPTGRQL